MNDRTRENYNAALHRRYRAHLPGVSRSIPGTQTAAAAAAHGGGVGASSHTATAAPAVTTADDQRQARSTWRNFLRTLYLIFIHQRDERP